jgi:serine-type D-Ala-D-Ala carboxypeptidase/endopeptidase
MKATTYEVDDVPKEKLAIGYRWENDAWAEEPSMAHGAFGSMGGVVTTANDYAKWVAFLLTGFEEPAGQVVAKPVIRAMQTGGGFPQARARPGTSAPDCRLAAVYAKGLISGNDCVLGPVLFHGGGFPGYGSHMLLVPETGSGVFALTNRTYAGPSGPVWDAATALFKAGHIAPRPSTISPTLDNAYGVSKAIWQDGGLANISQSALAMNFLMDRSADNWAKRIAELKAQSGVCDTSEAVNASGALSGSFEWQCEKGIIRGALLLAPTSSLQIQSLNFGFRKAAD